MILCSLSLTLLAIVAGMMLLAHTKKENLGNFYKYVSWFVIIVGFLMVLCIGARCAMSMCHRGGERVLIMNHRMMDDGDDGCMMMGPGMMGGHRGWMGRGMMGGRNMMMDGGCCNGMMMNGCCGHSGCNEGMSECHEGMGGGGCCHEGMNECHEGMGECKDGMGGGSCPMMKGMMEKKDTVVKKK